METQHRQGQPSTQAYRDYSRTQIASTLQNFADVKAEQSLRHFAAERGLPRSTVQGWLERRARLEASPEAVAFFTCPAGVAFLHRLYLAIHLVLTVLCPCGVRKVCRLLELSGLDTFIAASYGANYNYAKALEKALAEFDDEQRPQLIEHMTRALRLENRQSRPIIVLEDETFHPACCLVAIEAASNFILLETYSERRDADTWTRNMSQALEQLPVTVIAACSDEGKGVKTHIERDLGAHHCTELFHAQHEMSKGCSAALGRRVRSASQAVEKATERLTKRESEPRRRELERAQQCHQEACEHQEDMTRARRGVSRAYHPFDLKTGQARSPQEVSQQLTECFEQARQVADDAGLSQRAHQSIEKAARLKPGMVANVAFFHNFTDKRLKAAHFDEAHKRCLREYLIPSAYLQACARRASKADDAEALRDVSSSIMESIPAAWWQRCPQAKREELLAFAAQSASFFVRSDSPVEGRNGQLSLHHAGIHRLQPDKLRALTVIHNYFLTRRDGTTAAQRFFGAPHKDIFHFLLQRMPLPKWPAKPSSRKAPT